VDKVNGIKSYGMDKLNAVTNVGTRQVSRLLDNQAGQALVTQIGVAVDVVDSYVEKYLPEESGEQRSPMKSTKVEEQEGGQQAVVFNKAVEVGCKVSRRAYSRAVKRLQVIKALSVETVGKLCSKTDQEKKDLADGDAVDKKNYLTSDLRSYVGHLSTTVESMLSNPSATVKTMSSSVVATVMTAGSAVTTVVSRVTGAAWLAVTNLSGWIATTLARSPGKKSDASQAEEVASDASSSEQYYDEHSCDNHENVKDICCD